MKKNKNEIRTEALKILEELGIPEDIAIDMFYRQVVLHEGIPFPVELGRRGHRCHGNAHPIHEVQHGPWEDAAYEEPRGPWEDAVHEEPRGPWEDAVHEEPRGPRENITFEKSDCSKEKAEDKNVISKACKVDKTPLFAASSPAGEGKLDEVTLGEIYDSLTS